MPRPKKFVSRSDLGWGASPSAYADPRSGLVIHYDSADQGLAGKPHSACLDYWRNTRAFHTGRRGWVDIGYSMFGCAHGFVIEGRGLRKQQAAQPGGNASHYSCTLATGPNDTITADQINAVRALRQWLMDDYGNSGRVFGHRDFIATSCPGDRAYALVRDGTFTKPPGAIATGDDMLGLKKGDSGEAVELLQLKIIRAGFGAALGATGADSDYGPATAEGLRLCREYAGSEAKAGWGDEVTAHAVDQLDEAVDKRRLEKALEGIGSGGGLPATVRVSGELVVER